MEELKQAERLQDTRDQAISRTGKGRLSVCCSAGCAILTCNNLKRSDIRDGYIEITTVKTADRLVIDLNNHSMGDT